MTATCVYRRRLHARNVARTTGRDRLAPRGIVILLTLLTLLAGVPGVKAAVPDVRMPRQTGNPLAETESRKTIDDFGAYVIITADADWAVRWNTPAETSPQFATTDTLRIGQQATFLVFFTNPLMDVDGSVDVTWDLAITRPDHQITTEKGLKGYSGKLLGPVTNTYLVTTVMQFAGAPADPTGEWVVEVTVHDHHRHVSIPLRRTFQLVR